MAVKHYQSAWEGCQHVKVKADNTTAIVYVSHIGGKWKTNLTVKTLQQNSFTELSMRILNGAFQIPYFRAS